MRDYREAVNTINTLIHVTKTKVIIIDFEEPRESGWVPLLFNRYYRYMLRDQGYNFLTYNQFQGLFQQELDPIIKKEGFTLRIGCGTSLFGNAMWAVLDRKRSTTDSSISVSGVEIPNDDSERVLRT